MSFDAAKISEMILNKELAVASRNRGRLPYTAESGRFDDQSWKNISWWTNGFYGGMMWQLYNATDKDFFRECAREAEARLDEVFLSYAGMDHDAGFRWLPTAFADYSITGDSVALNRGLVAANALAGRFNLKGLFIRAWNDWSENNRNTGLEIIDCMMNLPLLYRASRELSDPRFYQIARAHALSAVRRFVREDGSVRHIVEIDPETGEFIGERGGQGIAAGSSWTRGQAWALYGFTLSFMHTNEKVFLDTAVRVADRFIERMPGDSLMPVDFDQEETCEWRDSSAAVIAACGLIELSEILGEPERDHHDEERTGTYAEAAIRLLSAIDELDADYSPETDPILNSCSAAFHDERHNYPIIYGDYFYIEAIFKLTEEDLFIW